MLDTEPENLLKTAESSNPSLPEATDHQLRDLTSCGVRKDIDLMNSTISHQSSPDLASTYSGKSSSLTRLKAVGSPIRNIPRETIREILSSCVSSAVDLAAFAPDSPPWNLTQICAVWRDIALESPNLWNDISVTFPCDQQECARLKDMLELFLSRAGNSTISLKMSAEKCYHPFYQPFINSIIDRVRPYIGRLRSLEVHPPDKFMPIMELPSSMVHALESVSLVFWKQDDEFIEPGDGLTEYITSFDNASNLQRVVLMSQYAYMHLTAFRFPWSQLTHLVILETLVDFVAGHEVLRQCKSLVSCSIGIAADSDDLRHAKLPPTHLPNLVSLIVHASSDEEEHGLFLQPLVLPSLQYLEIATPHDGLWSEMYITHLIKRSKPAKFEHFCSRATTLTPGVMSTILAEFHSLKELSLCFPARKSDPSLDELVTAIARGDLVPNIQSFKLELWGTWRLLRNRQIRQPSRITIQCCPEELRAGFWDILVKLQMQESLDVMFQADSHTRAVLGV